MTQDRTVPSSAPDTAAVMAERYGAARKTSRLLIVAVVTVVLAFIGWVLWAAYEQAAQNVRWRTVGYSNSSDTSVTVEFDVFKPAGSTATCVVHALDLQNSEVGRAEVPVTTDQSDARVVYTLAVTERPNAAEVLSCRIDH